MKRHLFAALLCLCAAPAPAQTEGSITFNLFEISGLDVSRYHSYSSADRADPERAPAIPFEVRLPLHSDYRALVDDEPQGGVVKFNFVTQAEPATLIENFHILNLDVPLFPEVADPNLARGQAMADFAQSVLWPQAVRGFSDAQILDIAGFRAGSLDGVHLIGRYHDPLLGPMLLRIAMVPDPQRPHGIVAVNNINLAVVPVGGPDDLLRTLGQSVLASLAFAD